jgi:hypothetical protein
MSDTDRLLHLSLLLKALDDCEQELVEFKAENKSRREKLEGELARLRWEVLSGQERLPLEPIPSSGIVPAMERVAEQINSGALDTPGVTCTAEVGPASESSVEEVARTKKQKKGRGQDVLLPAVPTPEPPTVQPGVGND